MNLVVHRRHAAPAFAATRVGLAAGPEALVPCQRPLAFLLHRSLAAELFMLSYGKGHGACRDFQRTAPAVSH
jgi:hypothetical protein